MSRTYRCFEPSLGGAGHLERPRARRVGCGSAAGPASSRFSRGGLKPGPRQPIFKPLSIVPLVFRVLGRASAIQAVDSAPPSSLAIHDSPPQDIRNTANAVE